MKKMTQSNDLIPKPKHYEFKGWLKCSSVAINSSEESALVKNGLNELGHCLGADKNVLKIAGRPTGPLSAGQCRIIIKKAADGRKLGAQGYRIASKKMPAGAAEICISGKSELGIYYGLKTFGRLVQAAGRTGKLPLVAVQDWPDLPVRGVYLTEKKDLDEAMIRLCSDLKLNVLKCGLSINPSDSNELSAFRKNRDECQRRGIRLIPYTAHFVTFFGDLLKDSHPDWIINASLKCAGVVGAKAKILLVDVKNAQARKWILNFLLDFARSLNCDEFEVWFTECYFPMLPANYDNLRERFLLEADIFAALLKEMRKEKPGFVLHVLLTQGTRRFNREIVQRFPKENVEIGFYDGEWTYSLERPAPIVLPEIAELAGDGYKIYLVNAWGRYGWNDVFLPKAAIMQKELEEAKADSLCGSVGFFARPDTNEINLYAGAEFSWNTQACAPEEFYRAYGLQKRIGRDHSSAACLSAIEQIATRAALVLAPDLGNFSYSPFTVPFGICKRLSAGGNVDDVEEYFVNHNVPAFLSEIAAARVELKAQKIPNILRDQVVLLENILEYCRSLLTAYYVNCRERLPHSNKGDWRDGLKKYRAELEKAKVALMDCRRICLRIKSNHRFLPHVWAALKDVHSLLKGAPTKGV